MATDPAKLEAVIALIEAGSSEKAACLQVGISRSTFRQAAIRVEGGVTYARACEALAKDQVERLEAAIAEMTSGENRLAPEIARIEIEARKWIASKLFRPQWGDKVALTGGGQADPPIETRVTIEIVKKG